MLRISGKNISLGTQVLGLDLDQIAFVVHGSLPWSEFFILSFVEQGCFLKAFLLQSFYTIHMKKSSLAEHFNILFPGEQF